MPQLMWEFEGDWADRFSHSPPRIHIVPGYHKAQKQPTAYTQPFNNKNKQNCFNWSLLLQLADYFRQMCHEEALTCSRVLLLAHCSSRQPSRFSGWAAHPWHNLPITGCQLVRQQDKRKDRQREQCSFLPSLQWVESVPPAFCPWK